jgi:hypothetical protein
MKAKSSGVKAEQRQFDLTFHDPDWRWVQEKCIRLCLDPEPHRRVLARPHRVRIFCFGRLRDGETQPEDQDQSDGRTRWPTSPAFSFVA